MSLDVKTGVLIIGGGMAGLSAAITLSRASVDCLIVEASKQPGGSSRLSAGMFWAPRDIESAHLTIPFGDPELQAAFISEMQQTVQWMRDHNVKVHSQFDGIMSIGIGFPIDIPQWLDTAERLIKASPKTSIMFETSAVELLTSQNTSCTRVTGALLRKVDGSLLRVQSQSTIIATGGFQGSPKLVSQHIGPGADNIFVRSNPYSRGAGFQLAQSVGAGTSRGLSTFYGHLLPSPLQHRDVDPRHFVHLAQFQSGYSILVNEHGKRFCDESFGDEVNNQHLAHQPGRKGYMILNEATRQRYALSEVFPNAGKIDRLEKARSVGGRVTKASSTSALLDNIAAWGVPRKALEQTLSAYNRAIESGESTVLLDASIGGNGTPHKALVEEDGPFWALEVQPSITFTYGGTKIDTSARALSDDGTVIPGLFVAGMDAGGFSNWRYCGGLALAFVTGNWAANAALSSQHPAEEKKQMQTSRL